MIERTSGKRIEHFQYCSYHFHVQIRLVLSSKNRKIESFYSNVCTVSQLELSINDQSLIFCGHSTIGGQHGKVNSLQEACAKCFAVHMLKFEFLQITWKKWNKKTSDP